MKILFRWLIMSGFFCLTACQSAVTPGTDQDAANSNSQVPSEQVEPMEIMPQSSMSDSGGVDGGAVMPDLTTTLDSNARALVQIAKADLAQRLKVNLDQIQLTKIEPVTWPDSSLGCPQMGGMYVQMLTPGYKITLETGGRSFSYHTDEKDRLVFCPTLRPGREILPVP